MQKISYAELLLCFGGFLHLTEVRGAHLCIVVSFALGSDELEEALRGSCEFLFLFLFIIIIIIIFNLFFIFLTSVVGVKILGLGELSVSGR